ncbi:sulfatase-like hydrolase/transferase [Echinicola soli]|uniref:Sulfatase-like hydrolase/transferase n=1 Tax=Echinicola soli TaxID=2591634 RepID=A0A514CP87_9BACT|nr:sulfatase-like hydrolase/transferase [Echinicola soli]
MKELESVENKLVIFTSYNNPWLTQKENDGLARLLFERKTSTYEGGMGVLGIAWWPGTFQSNQVSACLVPYMDPYPTFLKMTGVNIP